MKDLALLVLRIVSGGTLAAHGYTKLFGGEGRTPHPALKRIYGPKFHEAVQTGGPASFAKTLENIGVPYPIVAAYLSGFAEFGGGLALLAGIKTRLAALLVMANMAVAIWRVHWKSGLYGQGGYEFPAQIFGAALALFLAGPGAFSIDGVVGGTRRAAGAVSGGARGAAESVRGAAEAVRQSAGETAGAVGGRARGATQAAREKAGGAVTTDTLRSRAQQAAEAFRSALPITDGD